ncbi:hypothetical protein HPP92_024677 [Vanilla planifolia]|uniref:PB1 domain-containing protein n=1 Tax=Vanilla planifolia TaxID=51239 RepID=A0A835PMX9_VANPL|nr:hypothetical protein HPP92_024677 [Vanilla planifolia]
MICSSSSSCASFGSFDDLTVKSCSTVKFLCSYYGRILPCFPNGKLRYIGGENRVLSVDRSISLSELQVKLKELCGWQDVSLRCQLPTEDLDALVSITSDEDLVNVIEEFDLANRDRKYPIKVRAFLHPSTTKFTKSNSSVSPEAAAPTRNKVPFWNPVHPWAERCVGQIKWEHYTGSFSPSFGYLGHKPYRTPAGTIHRCNYYQ